MDRWFFGRWLLLPCFQPKMLDSLEAFIGFRGRDVQGRVRKGVVGERAISLSQQSDVLLYMKPFNLNWCTSASITSMQYSLFEAVLNSFAWPTNKLILLWAIANNPFSRKGAIPSWPPNPHLPPRAFSTKPHHTSSQPQVFKIQGKFRPRGGATILQPTSCVQGLAMFSFQVKLYHLEALMKVCPFRGQFWNNHLKRGLQMMLWCLFSPVFCDVYTGEIYCVQMSKMTEIYCGK